MPEELRLVPFYMDMFCANQIRTNHNYREFNFCNFIEYSVYMSEGAAKFHKIEHDSELGKEL